MLSPVSLTWLLWRRIMTIPATTSTLPGIAAGETLSPSITNANAAANNGMSSEIVAVTTDGNRAEAKAKAKLGIAVQSMASPGRPADYRRQMVSGESLPLPCCPASAFRAEHSNMSPQLMLRPAPCRHRSTSAIRTVAPRGAPRPRIAAGAGAGRLVMPAALVP